MVKIDLSFSNLIFSSSSMAAPRGDWGTCPPKSQKLAKIVKENGMKLAGYNVSLKTYVKIHPFLFGFFRAGAATDLLQKLNNTFFVSLC